MSPIDRQQAEFNITPPFHFCHNLRGLTRWSSDALTVILRPPYPPKQQFRSCHWLA